MSSQTLISPARRAWAIGLGVVTALCMIAWLIAYATMSFALKHAGYDAPPFYPGIFALTTLIAFAVTFPTAIICTIASVILVGWRRSKLAWISLCLYLSPLIVGIAQWALSSLRRSF